MVLPECGPFTVISWVRNIVLVKGQKTLAKSIVKSIKEVFREIHSYYNVTQIRPIATVSNYEVFQWSNGRLTYDV